MTQPAPRDLVEALAQTIVGQRQVIESLVVALLSDGHALLEGPPGVAKTLACRALAAAVGGNFKRVQFTPDLLPADITGTRIFDQRTAAFDTVLGPIFANVVLADEINRAPAKVQSALLEAMQERQVTIGPSSHPLPDVFLVLATMNPIDADGTYALPHAQLDRFLLKVRIGFPGRADELRILERFAVDETKPLDGVASMDDVRRWRLQAHGVHLDPKIKRYIVDLAGATREPHPYVEYGASPRASLALAFASRARAYLDGRDFVMPDDVRALGINVLAHRVAFTHRLVVDGVTPEDFVASILERVPAP